MRLIKAWPTVVVVGSGIGVASLRYGSLPTTSFYETCAQVIPVLIVALSVESRARDFWGNIATAYNAQIVAFLAVGELSALLAASGALASDNYEPALGVVGPTLGASYAMLGATMAGLVAGFIAVLVLALRGARGDEPSRQGAEDGETGERDANPVASVSA